MSSFHHSVKIRNLIKEDSRSIPEYYFAHSILICSSFGHWAGSRLNDFKQLVSARGNRCSSIVEAVEIAH